MLIVLTAKRGNTKDGNGNHMYFIMSHIPIILTYIWTTEELSIYEARKILIFYTFYTPNDYYVHAAYFPF